jgi:hypothetical protein
MLIYQTMISALPEHMKRTVPESLLAPSSLTLISRLPPG